MKIIRIAPDDRARFRIRNKTISNGKLYITETLKTSNEQEANQKAYERLLEIKLAEKKGSSLNKDTVAKAIDDFIAEYEDRLAKGFIGVYETHAPPVSENNLPLLEKLCWSDPRPRRLAR
jgi:glucose-6-phosphate 1-dehydrogenase